MADSEPGPSIVEGRPEVGSEVAPKSSARANRAVRKSTGKQGSTARTKVARKSTSVSTAKPIEVRAADLTAPDQASGQKETEAAPTRKSHRSAETSIRERVALLAYSYWEMRGCHGGSPEEDWFRAERELLENWE